MTTAEHYAAAFVDAYEDASTAAARHRVCDRFVEMIRADRVEPLAPAIVEAVGREATLREERARVKVVTAEEYGEKTFAALGDVELAQDPALIAGFTARSFTRRIDATVKGNLQALRRQLTS